MPFQKGHKKYGGRKKGSSNAATIEVKAALQTAFNGIGGIVALTTWAKENATEFYKLWGKMLPVEMRTPEGTNDILAGLVRDFVRGDLETARAEICERAQQPGEIGASGSAAALAESSAHSVNRLVALEARSGN